jgi:hypothetical protein
LQSYERGRKDNQLVGRVLLKLNAESWYGNTATYMAPALLRHQAT